MQITLDEVPVGIVERGIIDNYSFFKEYKSSSWKINERLYIKMEMSIESLLVAIENGKGAVVLPTHKTKEEREQLIGLNRLFNLYIVRRGHYRIIKQLWEEKYRIIKSDVPYISELGL